ncbi:membrane-associated progesterone binding protein 2 [Trypanosoma grayi]|uniref:membrane-associated progesterone binding protein 2 n=1 Tax=Trypanosoma grayi TaxID=71804 RepID=UPI0004F478BC|nr:membrane-associated progesterone binding protein 2 [Trypanosoma grayi]KEG14287.1 membrane-associated progesterone binding protein 2 [Trypanosoma grayi]
MERVFDAAELLKYNGEGGAPIYISVMGIVYDCSSAADFYGPGASYHVFAGKDVSRCLAKMLIDDAEANADWHNLADEHRSTLDEWVTKYQSKYPVVGRLATDERFIKRGAAMEP